MHPTGGPLISTYSVTRDAAPLLKDAVKVMALKTAMYERTSDELAAEPPVRGLVRGRETAVHTERKTRWALIASTATT